MVDPVRPHDASSIYRRQISQAESAEALQHARRLGAGAAGSGPRSDRVTLSEGAREFARIMAAVTEAPETRADRVEMLRSRVHGGQYEVDYHGLAALLYDRGFGATGS